MIAGNCKHFTGIQNDACAAGVRYLDARDSTVRPYRWPCLTIDQRPSVTTCPSFVAITLEEEAESLRRLDAALAAFAAGKSPCCDAPLIAEGTARYCSKCHGFVAYLCNPSEEGGHDEEPEPARPVPRGKEVPPAAVLRHLPKSPPRRKGDDHG